MTGASGWPTETRVILPALPRFMPVERRRVEAEAGEAADLAAPGERVLPALAAVDLQHDAAGEQRAERRHDGHAGVGLGLVRQLEDADLGDRVLLLVDARAGT